MACKDLGKPQNNTNSPPLIQPVVPSAEFVDTSEPAVPGAHEVFVDVQSVMFWSRFQKGGVGRWSYTLFPDGSASVSPNVERWESAFTLVCNPSVNCVVTRSNGSSFVVPATGQRSEIGEITGGEALARYIAQWILAGTVDTESTNNFSIVATASSEPSASSDANIKQLNANAPSPKPETPPPDPLTSSKTKIEAPKAATKRTGEAAPAKAKSDSATVNDPVSQTLPLSMTSLVTSSGDKDVKQQPNEKKKKNTQPKPSSTSGTRVTMADNNPKAQKPYMPSNLPAKDRDSPIECQELPGFWADTCIDDTPVDILETYDPYDPSTWQDVKVGGRPPNVDTEKKRPAIVERLGLNCAVTGTFNMRYDDPDTGNSGPGKPRVSLGCGGKLTKKLSFHLLLRTYLIPEHQQPWDPDFTYAFTYKFNNRLNLTYSNYLARFDGPNGEGELVDSLLEGDFRLNYKFPSINLPRDKRINCVGGVGLPEIANERFSLSCGIRLSKKLSIGGTAYLYFPGQQGEYDPDFSYTASYKINDKFTLSYSNYSNNRWIGNESNSPGPGFVGGSLSLTYKISF